MASKSSKPFKLTSFPGGLSPEMRAKQIEGPIDIYPSPGMESDSALVQAALMSPEEMEQMKRDLEPWLSHRTKRASRARHPSGRR